MSFNFPTNSLHDTLLKACNKIIEEVKKKEITEEEAQRLAAIGGLLYAAGMEIEKLEILKKKELVIRN
jgi:hypothetical protein